MDNAWRASGHIASLEPDLKCSCSWLLCNVDDLNYGCRPRETTKGILDANVSTSHCVTLCIHTGRYNMWNSFKCALDNVNVDTRFVYIVLSKVNINITVTVKKAARVIYTKYLIDYNVYTYVNFVLWCICVMQWPVHVKLTTANLYMKRWHETNLEMVTFRRNPQIFRRKPYELLDFDNVNQRLHQCKFSNIICLWVQRYLYKTYRSDVT